MQFFVVIKRFDFCPFLYIFMTTLWLPLEMTDLFLWGCKWNLAQSSDFLIWKALWSRRTLHKWLQTITRLCLNIYFFPLWKVRWSPHSPLAMSEEDERSYLLSLKDHVAAETEDCCTAPYPACRACFQLRFAWVAVIFQHLGCGWLSMTHVYTSHWCYQPRSKYWIIQVHND